MRTYPPLAAHHPLVTDAACRCYLCNQRFVTGDITTLLPIGHNDGGRVDSQPAHESCARLWHCLVGAPGTYTLQIAGANATYYTCPKCHAASYNWHDVQQMYCGCCHTFAEALRDVPVTEFAHLTNIHLTHRNCFSLAALTLFDSPNNPDARLVHGRILSSFAGEHVEHAWCEFPATATYEDGSTGPIIAVVDYSQLDKRAVFLPAPDLYRVWQARDIRRFTRDEAIANAVRYGNDGPWPIEKSSPTEPT